jgi:hypothetical protein
MTHTLVTFLGRADRCTRLGLPPDRIHSTD